jgi:hypothetical protein
MEGCRKICIEANGINVLIRRTPHMKLYSIRKTRLQLESEFRKFINGGNLLQNNFHIEAPQVELTPLHAHYAFKTL